MNVNIHFSHVPSPAESIALEALADKLTEFRPHIVRAENDAGRKGGGIALAIAITGAAASVIGVLVSTISLWRSSLPTCTVTVKKGSLTQSFVNLSPRAAQDLVEKLQSESDDNIDVAIVKGETT